MNQESSDQLKDRRNKLPKLKNKLDERVMITKGSNEAAILAKAAARVPISGAQLNGE